MDRRSWLWRRKSSDKSPGETESSGSISSHSERFSDEHAYLNHNSQSPEVTSKAIPNDEELTDSVKTLREKLALALQNISSKDDMVNQHSKVAEEAVSGWEKAENEVIALKQQLESSTQKSSLFEDRAIHLDVALKECMSQLGLEQEEHKKIINEAVTKKTNEWEFTKSQLQQQLVELQSQLQAAKDEADTSLYINLRSKLEAAEKEISSLKNELFSRAEELELRTIERDLSSHAAESASRQNLESLRKVAKLETECCKLKALACKASSVNNQRSAAESSVYVESCTDSQSDTGDRLLLFESDTPRISEMVPNKYKTKPLLEQTIIQNPKAFERNSISSSLDISLMDDFLEMEKLVALPESRNVSFHKSRAIMDQSAGENIGLRTELESMRNRTAELEEKLVKMGADNNELETSLIEHQGQLRTLRDCLEEAEMKLLKMEANKNEWETYLTKHQDQLATVRNRLEDAEMNILNMEADKNELETSLTKHQDQMDILRNHLEEVEMKLVELQTELAMANEARATAESELTDTNLKKEVAESQLEAVNNQLKSMTARISSLEEEIQNERSFAEETLQSCQKLEKEISIAQHETELRKAESSRSGLKQNQDEELAVAAYKF